MSTHILIALLAAVRGDPCTDAHSSAFWGAFRIPASCTDNHPNSFVSNHVLWLNSNTPGLCECALGAVGAGAMPHVGNLDCEFKVPMLGVEFNVADVITADITQCKDLSTTHSLTKTMATTNEITLDRRRLQDDDDTTGYSDEVSISSFWAYIGSMIGFVGSVLGSAYGTAACAVGIQSAGVIHPHTVMKNLISVVMAGIIGIYGLIVSIMIVQKMDPESLNLFQGFALFAAGLCVGGAGLASGISLGKAGQAMNKAIAEEEDLFIGGVLILIFSNAPALYGFLTAILLISGSG